MNSMSMIYATAATTLILDAELRKLPAHTDPTTLMAYATFSGWTTRAWTLQEGSLPESVIFALSDGIFDPKHQEVYAIPDLAIHSRDRSTVQSRRSLRKRLLSRWRENAMDQDDFADAGLFDEEIRERLLSYWSENQLSIWLREGRSRNSWEGEAIRQIWNGLTQRHTSEVKELPMLLANLLNLRASVINESDQPVAKIIGSLRYIPVGLLYNTGKRLRPIFASKDAMIHQTLNTATVPDFTDCEYLNRWVPTAIEGTNIPDGPIFLAIGSSLRMYNPRFSDHSESKATIFTSYMITTLSPKFIVKHAADPTILFVVTVDCQPDDEMINKRLEGRVKGICFVMGAALDDPQENRKFIGGAALAIVDETPEELTTIFLNAVQIEIADEEDARDDFSDFPVVLANYSVPELLVMLYSEYLSQKLPCLLTDSDSKELGPISSTAPTSIPGPLAAQSHIFVRGGVLSMIATAGSCAICAFQQDLGAKTAFGVYMCSIVVYVLLCLVFFRWAEQRRLFEYLQYNSLSRTQRISQILRAIAVYPIISGLGFFMLYAPASLALMIALYKADDGEQGTFTLVGLIGMIAIVFGTLLFSTFSAKLKVVGINGVFLEPRLGSISSRNGKLPPGFFEAIDGAREVA